MGRATLGRLGQAFEGRFAHLGAYARKGLRVKLLELSKGLFLQPTGFGEVALCRCRTNGGTEPGEDGGRCKCNGERKCHSVS